MQGIIVFKFSPDTPSTVRDRFLIALGKLFDSCIPFSANAVLFKVDRLSGSVRSIAEELKHRYGPEVVISLHYSEDDLADSFTSTEKLI